MGTGIIFLWVALCWASQIKVGRTLGRRGVPDLQAIIIILTAAAVEIALSYPVVAFANHFSR